MNKANNILLSAFEGLSNIEKISLPKNWFSLAFNRILHEDFSPKYMWDFLMEYCKKWPSDVQCYVGEEEYYKTHGSTGMDKVNLDSSSILEYLTYDFRFNVNHVVIPLSGSWALRIDQDVIYFIFNSEDRDFILNSLGGVDAVEDIILREFDGVKGRRGIVEKYVSDLLKLH